ncbi:MAG: TetR/AcrR family transcriptional regulator [Candidatus Lokiarchaeota archaeon]|nr:TetR/AcrR family transcriptional regulator [Candidatus Lokiarchaeota archaeon]
MPSSKKFTRNKEQKIEIIIKTTLALILEKGYNKLSTNHIAKKAGIGIGTIYRNFPNGKEDIVKAIIVRNRDKIINLELFNHINESNLPNSIKTLMINFIKFHRENYHFHLAFVQAHLSNNKLFNEFKFLIQNGLDKLAKKVKKSNLSEKYSEKELKDQFFSLFNIIEAIILRHILIMPLFDTDEELGTYLTNLVLFHFSR